MWPRANGVMKIDERSIKLVYVSEKFRCAIFMSLTTSYQGTYDVRVAD